MSDLYVIILISLLCSSYTFKINYLEKTPQTALYAGVTMCQQKMKERYIVMKVYGFSNEKEGLTDIDNTLKAMQKFVGGRIEKVSFTDEIDLICNEEGKILGMLPSAAWFEDNELVDVICGDCFLCRFDNKGNFTDIKGSDVEIIERKLKSLIRYRNNIKS